MWAGEVYEKQRQFCHSGHRLHSRLFGRYSSSRQPCKIVKYEWAPMGSSTRHLKNWLWCGLVYDIGGVQIGAQNRLKVETVLARLGKERLCKDDHFHAFTHNNLQALKMAKVGISAKIFRYDGERTGLPALHGAVVSDSYHVCGSGVA